MIPKKIHYCWFGGKPKSKLVCKCIESWNKFCPEYEIKEWNENNFNIELCDYSKEAYSQKKWAFVSDVARIYALYNEGGIYLDTDVEILRNLDTLLYNKSFLGFEGTKWIATNIIGSEKNNDLFLKFLEEYYVRHFIKEDGSLDLTTNVEELTSYLVAKYNLILDGSLQHFDDFTIYPTDYFSPYDYIQGKLNKTKNTYTIHWFSQSWIPQNSIRKIISQMYHRLVGLKMK